MEFKHWEDKAQTKTMKRNIYAMIFTGFTLVTISLIFYLYLGDNFKFACLIGKIEQYKCVNQAPEYPPDYCGRKSDNPLLKEELRPGCDVISDGFLVKIPEIHIKINSKGLRDYEYEIEKPVNTFRIVAIGDSHTFGWGVELNKSYPKVLEKLLNKKTEKIKYEVLNFGIPGYGTFEEIEFFKQLGMKFGPDLVILQYGGDDIT